MRGYKALRPIEEHRRIVGLLLGLALERHTKCAGRLGGSPVTHWATVPSLPAKPGEHPLRGLALGHGPGTEIPLTATARVQQPRIVNPEHFACGVSLPADSHVLVIDDTWTTGGHAQSAALGLRTAGAGRISVLVVARWLKEDYKNNKEFIADLEGHDYNPAICPWTDARCP
jgi:hypothetical protein